MPVRLLRPYNGQNANTLYVGTDEAILRAIGIADDYIENATNFVPFASQAFRAFASSFSTASPAGSFITSFSNPFAGQGRGITTYTLTGTVPPQVALSASGRSLVVGSTAAVAGTIYSVNVTATSGDGLLTTQPATLSFMAMAQAPLVAGGGGTVTPTPTPGPSLNVLSVSVGIGTVGTGLSSTISGLTSGSSLSLSGAGAPGLSISGAVINGTPTAAGPVNLTETLAGASNSPRTTNNLINISASSVIVAPARYAAFSDDLEGTGLLSARPNWSDLGTGLLPKWSTSDGFAYVNQRLLATNTVVFGSAVTDFIFTLGYDFTGVKPTGNTDTDVWQSNSGSTPIWYQDTANFLEASYDTTLGRISVSGKVAGTNTSQVRFDQVTFAASKVGEIVFQMKAGVLRIRLDGKWLFKGPSNSYPLDQMDLTGLVPSSGRTGYVGLKAYGYRYAQAQYINVTPLDISVDFIQDAVGRDVPGGTTGTADLTGTYTGTPTRWIYRVLNYGTSVVVQDWRDLAANTANGAAGLPLTNGSGAAFAGLPSLPVGGPYAVEAGYIGSDGLRHTSTSTAVLVCIRGTYYGQSNSTGMIAVYTPASTPAQATARTVSTNGPYGVFCSPNRPYTYPLSYELSRGAAPMLGVPVMMDVCGQPGVGIELLVPGSTGWDTFITGLNSTRGVIEFVVWDQGEGNADGAAGPAGYSDKFRNQLLPGIRSVTGNPNVKVLINPVGRYAQANQPFTGITPAQNDAYRRVLRAEYLDIIAKEPNVSFAASKLGMIHGDGYHYTTAGYTERARREAFTIAKAFGANVHDGLGPKVTSATRSGAVITLNMNMNGATGLTGPVTLGTGTVPTPTLANSFNGFLVSKDSFATALPISSIAVSGNTLVITLASDPGGAVSVRSHDGWSYDDTVTYQGTYSDTTPIPIFPIMTDLVAA